jgi:hypothetical protein
MLCLSVKTMEKTPFRNNTWVNWYRHWVAISLTRNSDTGAWQTEKSGEIRITKDKLIHLNPNLKLFNYVP